MTTTRIPKNIADSVKKTAFELCNKFNYSRRSRAENNAFITNLVNNPQVGGILQQYVPQDKIRTYIKDAVLHQYSRRLAKNLIDKIDIGEILSRKFKTQLTKVGRSSNNSYIFKQNGSQKQYYIAKIGTLVKWETALRKALEYRSTNKMLSDVSANVNICLILLANGGTLTKGDKQQIETVLNYINVQVHFVM